MTTPQTVGHPEITAGAGGSGRRWALAALALSGLVIGLDPTVFSVALLGATAW
jgi:hypothetical protein